MTGSRSEIAYDALPVDDPQVRLPEITRARAARVEPEISLEDGFAAWPVWPRVATVSSASPVRRSDASWPTRPLAAWSSETYRTARPTTTRARSGRAHAAGPTRPADGALGAGYAAAFVWAPACLALYVWQLIGIAELSPSGTFCCRGDALARLGAGSLVLLPLVPRRPPAGRAELDRRRRVARVRARDLRLRLGERASSAAYRAVFALAAAGGAWAALRAPVWGARPPRIRTWRPWEQWLGGILIAYAVLGAVATSAPISSPDAPLPRRRPGSVRRGRGGIFEVPANSSSYEPFTVQMLVLDGFLLWDSVQGAFTPFLLALVAGGRRGRRGGSPAGRSRCSPRPCSAPSR